MNTRHDWFVTATGKRVFVLRPEVRDICIEDIAHALSMICRFGGHTRAFYSVAQHSVLVSRNLPPELALAGLLHDATEAYLGDVIRPLKRVLGVYADLETIWWEIIAQKFGLPEELPPDVKVADVRALVTERRDLVAPEAFAWNWKEDEAGAQPFIDRIHPLEPTAAREEFLRLFRALAPQEAA